MDWIKIKTEHISPTYTMYEVGLLLRYQLMVARLKRHPTLEEMRIELPMKRLEKLEKKILNLYQIDLKTIAERVLVDVKSVEDVRQYERDRKRKYRLKKQMSQGTGGDSPTVDKIREDKNIYIADKSAFDFSEYLKSMDDHKQRHIQVIAFYFKEKGLSFDSAAKVQAAIKRHLRAAKELSVFSDPEINKAVKKAKQDYPDIWTIETLLKILTR